MIVRLRNGIVIAFVLSVLTPGTLLAHAHLVASDPAAGGSIATPYVLSARFSAAFDPDRSFIRVHDSSGARVALGAVSEDDPTIMIVELPTLEPGEYEVRWQTVTPDDSGVENDTFSFKVVAPATSSPTPGATPSPSAAPTGTSAPTVSAIPSSSPAPSPSATASAQPIDGSPSGSSTDLVLALALAAVAIGAVVLFIFARNRR